MAFLVATRHVVGEWLSLVEHLVRDQGVGGSNPLSPTNFSLADPAGYGGWPRFLTWLASPTVPYGET